MAGLSTAPDKAAVFWKLKGSTGCRHVRKHARGLTPAALLQEALTVLEGYLPQALPRGQQAAGRGGGRKHRQGGAF